MVVLFVWGWGFYVSTFFPPPKIPKPFQPTLNPPKLKASHPSSGLKVVVVVGLVGLVVVVVGLVGLVVVVVLVVLVVVVGFLVVVGLVVVGLMVVVVVAVLQCW